MRILRVERTFLSFHAYSALIRVATAPAATIGADTAVTSAIPAAIIPTMAVVAARVYMTIISILTGDSLSPFMVKVSSDANPMEMDPFFQPWGGCGEERGEERREEVVSSIPVKVMSKSVFCSCASMNP